MLNLTALGKRVRAGVLTGYEEGRQSFEISLYPYSRRGIKMLAWKLSWAGDRGQVADRCNVMNLRWCFRRFARTKGHYRGHMANR